MPHHNLDTIHVIGDNTLLIFSGALSWTLTLLGVDTHHLGVIFTGGGWEIADYLINHLAILLSCGVSLATLFKIKKDLKKK